MPWRLLFAHLRKAWFRTLLTGSGVALSVFLLTTLRTVITALDSAIAESSTSRLIVTSSLGLFKNQPKRLEAELRSVKGIAEVTHWTWFGGIFIDEHQMFSRFATDPESLRNVYGRGARPDMIMPTEQWEAFASDRRACVAGIALCKKYGLRLGDKVEMQGNIFPGHYTFTLRGIYEKGREQMDEQILFFQWKYLDEVVAAETGSHRNEVGIYSLLVEKGADAAQITRDVDARFESSDHATRTVTEAAFNQMFVSMWGNVPLLLTLIGGAVLFAAFMIALNTMLLSGRERRLEFGVLKALGFGDDVVFVLLLAEGVWVCGLAGIVGVGAAKWLFDVQKVPVINQFFPAFRILPETTLLAVGVAVAVGVVSAVVPAFLASRMKPVDALSRRA